LNSHFDQPNHLPTKKKGGGGEIQTKIQTRKSKRTTSVWSEPTSSNWSSTRGVDDASADDDAHANVNAIAIVVDCHRRRRR
jgi:hypothetical protein